MTRSIQAQKIDMSYSNGALLPSRQVLGLELSPSLFPIFPGLSEDNVMPPCFGQEYEDVGVTFQT